MREVQDQVLANLRGDLSVPALAPLAGMSDRTIARVLRSETRCLAEESDLPAKRLADMVGYASVDGFRRAFTRRLGASLVEYRKRFAN